MKEEVNKLLLQRKTTKSSMGLCWAEWQLVVNGRIKLWKLKFWFNNFTNGKNVKGGSMWRIVADQVTLWKWNQRNWIKGTLDKVLYKERNENKQVDWTRSSGDNIPKCIVLF